MQINIATSGHIERYDVFVLGDIVKVVSDTKIVASQRIEGIGDFLKQARDFRLGWGKFPDGAEVVYLYDKADDNYGYAVNLTDPSLSEWGYAPFGCPDC